MFKCYRWLFVVVIGFAFCGTVAAQTRSYSKTQITSGAFNHESPSLNNRGDVVWSQHVGGFWQVYILAAGAASATRVAGQAPDHNNTNPTIDEAGDVMYLKDGVGQGVARAVILNRGSTESIIEFSSRNSLTGDHRDAGQHFGIAGNGTTISYYDFVQFGFGVRRLNVGGVGTLQCASGPCDFDFSDFPDINNNGTFVYSSFGAIFSAPVSAPNSPTPIASGAQPRIADIVPPATMPEVVYIMGGTQVVSTIGGVVDVGSSADVNNAGSVVYAKAVGGFDQVFLATTGSCGTPTAESILSLGWDVIEPTKLDFLQTVSNIAGDSFAGRTVQETTPSPVNCTIPGTACPDTCWYLGGPDTPFVSVTGGTHPVDSGNSYPDIVGWARRAVVDYSKNRAPCHTIITQVMAINDCNGGFVKYISHTVTVSIDARSIRVEKDGVFESRLIGDVDGDGVINCIDMGIVRVALGKRAGQLGFDPRVDVNGDGIVDIRDLAFLAQRLPAGTRCK